MQSFTSIGWQGAENEVRQASAYLGCRGTKNEDFWKVKKSNFQGPEIVQGDFFEVRVYFFKFGI